MHVLKQLQILPASRPEVWEFVSTPRNLNLITPPDMDFRIVGEVAEKCFAGQLIEYRIKVPLLGRTTWLTEIKFVEEGISFVDEQRVGPYKLWIHRHRLEDCEEGTKMTDEIRYLLPFGLLGKVAERYFVRGNLERIFAFRRSRLSEIFSLS
tara:strand:- start:344 stop:799 length:456 start_codon:yes stop_codon:yes gene_type:complete